MKLREKVKNEQKKTKIEIKTKSFVSLSNAHFLKVRQKRLKNYFYSKFKKICGLKSTFEFFLYTETALLMKNAFIV